MSRLGDAHWRHIGLQYLSPYMPCFQVMQHSDAPAPMEGIVRLQGVGSFPNTMSDMAEFDKACLWWGVLCRLWESNMPLANVQPSQVFVKAIAEPTLFWDAGKTRRARRARDPAGPDVGDAFVEAAPLHDAEDGAGAADDADGVSLRGRFCLCCRRGRRRRRRGRRPGRTAARLGCLHRR